MPRIVGADEAFPRSIQLRDRVRVPFMDSSAAAPEKPYVILNQMDAGHHHDNPHYHTIDQWQLIVAGNAVLGRQQVGPYYVFFTRAYTPYTIVPVKNETMSYFDFWTHYQPGALNLYGPEKTQNKNALLHVENRRPWHFKQQIIFPSQRGEKISRQFLLEAIPGDRDDDGLACHTLVVAPNARAMAPDPSVGDGQFIAVVTGSLFHDGKNISSYAVIFVEPKNGPFELVAGPDGLEAIVLNFPRAKHSRVAWECPSCSYVFDEANTVKEGGTIVGKRWRDLPPNWVCPECSTPKIDFGLIELG